MRGRPADRDEVRVLLVEFVQLGQNGESHLESFGIDPDTVPVRTHTGV
jgi:hypothetical protein